MRSRSKKEADKLKQMLSLNGYGVARTTSEPYQVDHSQGTRMIKAGARYEKKAGVILDRSILGKQGAPAHRDACKEYETIWPEDTLRQ